MEKWEIVNWDEEWDEETPQIKKPLPKARKKKVFPPSVVLPPPLVVVQKPDKAELQRLEVESDMNACKDTFGF